MADWWRDYIAQGATQRGVDPRAALAVAMTEGLGGGVGDNGTSFGPFQLHVGGALPAGKGRAWAESKAGIDYALDRIASVAKGQTGNPAINSIVRRFERPADPNSQVRKAIANYGATGNFNTGPLAATPTAATPVGTTPAAADPRAALLQHVMKQNEAFAKEEEPVSMIGTLLAAKAAKEQAEIAKNEVQTPTTQGTPPGQPGPNSTPTFSGPWDNPLANTMKSAIEQARAMGLTVGGNPYVTGHPETSGHTEDSHHYQTFGETGMGRAIDVSGDPAKLDAYFQWAEDNLIGKGLNDMFYDPRGYSYDKGKRWDATIGGHSHVHLSI